MTSGLKSHTLSESQFLERQVLGLLNSYFTLAHCYVEVAYEEQKFYICRKSDNTRIGELKLDDNYCDMSNLNVMNVVISYFYYDKPSEVWELQLGDYNE